ncbi:homeobox-leucine zipper protein ROC6-like [Vicia villosa]|uniref:homeobox-leucine zipper protein ROC6-like n=1 Tax=Vicia villosa TaxID=3911 RepID=UPI00273C18AB|nr:homeobox-leucine zipper protein ROC6-like [Vicia villosa]
MDRNGQMGLIGENFESGLLGRMREDEYESRSGSENFDGGSGDELDAGDDQPRSKKKKYHRHTPQQIQELETFFKECPHPDEKQRSDLSKKLGLEIKQVKFWFQNRRTQMKTQMERHENMILKQENDKLRAENSLMKDAMANPICSSCGGPAIPGQISMEEHQIRIENARLKEELSRVCTLSNKFLGRPLSPLAPISMQTQNPGLDFGMGRNGVGCPSNFNMSLPMGFDMGDGVMGTPPPYPGSRTPMGMMVNDAQQERSMLYELAFAAMDELIKMSQPDSPLWIKASDGTTEVLNHEEYARIGSPFNDPKPTGFVTEASRETGQLFISSAALVGTMLDADRWAEMFPCMIARAQTLDVISNGMDGSRNGSIQVMQAEIQLPSPLVPVRQYTFLRYCKQHAEGVWVVVDVSIDINANSANGNPFMSCKRLPSGCILQDMNGFCNVTWVDHSQYDESVVHQNFRPLVNSGTAFGAHRWLATLQRQCELLAIVMSSLPTEDATGMSPAGKGSMLKLAQKMSDYFLSGICPSSACKWDLLHIGNMGSGDMKIMSRKHMDGPGECIVLSASSSVWMPVSRQRVFDFLIETRMRGEWDALSNGGTMLEMVHIAKGQALGNSVSILRANNADGNGNEAMLYLQDSWTDSSGSMIVYSPVSVQSLKAVMGGGDSSFVALLPCGFSILPDGHSNGNNIMGDSSDGSGNFGADTDNSGCLLTVGVQMLLKDLPTGKLTKETLDTVDSLVGGTIQKVKDALGVA